MEEHEVAQIEAQSAVELLGLMAVARELVIADHRSEQAAADLRTEIVTRRKRIETWFQPLCAAAAAAHRALTTRRAAATEPYEEPLRIIDQKLTQYRTDCERQRKAAAEAASMGNGDDIVAPPETTFPEKVDGISYSEHWSAVVEDLTTLQNAVAEGKAPRQSTEASQKFLDGLARSLKSELNIPGVKAVCEKRVRSR